MNPKKIVKQNNQKSTEQIKIIMSRLMFYFFVWLKHFNFGDDLWKKFLDEFFIFLFIIFLDIIEG